MGFKKSWDAADIMSQIQSLSRECRSPHNDGFTGWNCKQDLLIIQELINEALKDSPTFGDLEMDWLKNREQQRIIKILKQ